MQLKALFYIFTLTVTIISSGCHNSESTSLMEPNSTAITPIAPDLLRVDYKGFTLWMDCDRRSAARFELRCCTKKHEHI